MKKCKYQNGPTEDDIKNLQINNRESQNKNTLNKNSKTNNKAEDVRKARKQ
ncbi:hypothetical protein L9F63_018042, partial [Diploptera punctata]